MITIYGENRHFRNKLEMNGKELDKECDAQ